MNTQPQRRSLADVAHVDLALSGGGFRAALFHLGVIGCLRRNRLLGRTRHICSVSGGSILAAHLVVNWGEYKSDKNEKFEAAVRRLVDGIRKRDISREVIDASKRRLFRLKGLDSELLAKAYDTLIVEKGAVPRWDELATVSDIPQLHVLATHLNTGRACAFAATGFSVLGEKTHAAGTPEADALAQLAQAADISSQPITRAVAASSAFPPLFAPLQLDPERPEQLLTDGGVYDNSGVKYLEHLYAENRWTGSDGRLVLVSDAGRRFSADLKEQYDRMLALAQRVTDAQGDRIAQFDTAAAAGFFAGRGVLVARVSIHDRIAEFPAKPSGHSAKVQRLLAEIRTELDRFTAHEVLALYRHGYLATQQELAKYFTDAVADDSPWTPVDVEPRTAGEATMRSTNSLLSHVDSRALEEALADGYLVKKYGEIGSGVRRLALGVVIALTLISAGAGVGIYEWLRDDPVRTVERVAPSGSLQITIVERYSPDTWAVRLPLLVAASRKPDGQVFYRYLVESQALTTLTDDRPLSAGTLRIELRGPLSGAEVYPFIARIGSQNSAEYVTLERPGDRGDYTLPPLDAASRVRAMLVLTQDIEPVNIAPNVSIRVNPQ